MTYEDLFILINKFPEHEYPNRNIAVVVILSWVPYSAFLATKYFIRL